MSTGIATIRHQLASRTAALADQRSVPRIATDIAIVQGGAAIGGFADTYMPGGIGGIQPSLVGGLAATGVAVFTRSPVAAKVASGLLAGYSRQAGAQAAAAVMAPKV